MLLPVGWATYDCWIGAGNAPGEAETIGAFVIAIAIGIVSGCVLFLLGRGSGGQLGRREALLLVALGWIVGGAFAALPFWIWAGLHDFPQNQDPSFQSWINSYFEAMSGLTTTGATVLVDIPTIPHGLLMWRAMTHWLGGLGIVVLFVAVLPMLGVGGKRLFRIETTGPSAEGVTPRIQDTAQLLWLIYLTLTAAEMLLLRFLGGMSWFESVTHTFATLATGGFSTENGSIGAFSPLAHWIVIAFMLLAGINFGLYHQILRGRFREVLRNTELRVYLAILLVASLIVLLSIYGTPYPDTTGRSVENSAGHAVRDAVFQVVSIQTTTGFCTANFEEWSFLVKGVLIGLMFIGGCGGSTGGGIKVVRILVICKVMLVELERAFRPNVVRPIRVGQNPVDEQQRLAILAYAMGIVVLFCLGTLLLMALEESDRLDGVTAATAVVATLNNIGPGLSRVGAIENYAWFSDASKLLLCLLMAVGRLEVFAILALFMPRFWRTQ